MIRGRGRRFRGMSKDLHDCWTQVVEAIRHECNVHGFDPDAVKADEHSLSVSLPLDGATGRTIWFSRDQVLNHSAKGLAAFFYQQVRP